MVRQTISFSVPFAVNSLGNIVLEDFATLRLNASGANIWAPTTNPNQSGSLGANLFDVNVTAAESGGTDPGCGLYTHFWPYPYNAANQQGYAHAWIKSGTWDINVNRLSFWLKAPINKIRRSDGGDTWQLGTYVRSFSDNLPNDQGQHYYHLFDPNLYVGKWSYWTINRVPQHQVGANSNINWPEDPEWPPNGTQNVHYFDGLTRFYLEELAFSGAGHWQFSDFEFRKDTNGEPDTLVSSIVAQHNGTAYELSWATIKNQTQHYDISYSTSDLHVNGFASGTVQLSAVVNPGSAYVGCAWKSPNMAQVPTIYFGIRPTGGTAFTQVKLVQKT